MNRKNILLKIATYVGIPLLFALVCAVYFYPQLDGEVIPSNDVTQYEGMSRDIKDMRDLEGVDTGWTGRMFGGMPAYLITVKYPATIIRNSANAVQKAIGQPIGFIVIAMLSFWLMLVMFGVNPWVGLISSLAYGLSTYFFIIIGAGHVTKMWALAYAPLLIGGVAYTYRKNIWLGGALTALFAAIEIGAGHPQITYYFGLIIAAYAINEFVMAVRNKTLGHFAKATAILLVAAALSVGANYSSLHYTMSHSSETTRGGSDLAKESSEKGGGLDLEYATQWSYGKAETLNTFIPDLMGGASGDGFSTDGPVAKSLAKYGARDIAVQLPAYWGDQPYTAGPTYIGAVAIFFALLGALLLEGRKKWWIIGVSILAIMLAWGSNMMWFTELAFKVLPGYNKFRTVSMTLAIVEFTVPLLGALALAKMWEGVDRKKLLRSTYIAAGVTGGIALICALFGSSLFDMTSPIDAHLGLPGDVLDAMQQERASILSADAVRSLLFVALSAGVVLLWGVGKLRKWALIACCAVLVLADMLPVNHRYLPTMNEESRFEAPKELDVEPTPADLYILQDEEPGFRVQNLAVSTFNDATTSYFHRSVGGYHGAKLSRYQDLIEHYLGDPTSEVYRMLNNKYTISIDKESGQYAIKTHPERLGAAWFVDRVLTVSSPQDEIAAVGQIDLACEAVVDEHFAELYNKAVLDSVDQQASIKLISYRPHRLGYRSSSQTDEIAVFSEIYYPNGWSVTIDGKPAEYFRANYVLRAMVIPAGEHYIEWTFNIPDFDKVESVTLTCSIIILAAIVAAAVATFIQRKKRKTSDETGR